MSEPVETRVDRIQNAIYDALVNDGHSTTFDLVECAWDALLAALEPPVADMVRRGVEGYEERKLSPALWTAATKYRPRAEP